MNIINALDFRLAALMTSVVCVFLSLMLVFAWRTFPTSIHGIAQFALGAFLISIFWFSRGVQDILPASSLRIFGQFIYGLALLCWLEGLKALFDRKNKLLFYVYWVIFASYIITLSLLTLFNADVKFRLLLLLFFTSFVNIRMAFIVFPHKHDDIWRMLWSLILFCGAIASLWRIMNLMHGLIDETLAVQVASFNQFNFIILITLSLLNPMLFFFFATQRLHFMLNENMHLDYLTGIYNRRGLARFINHNADKIGAVFMIDLDNFKHINDQYGHDVGDNVLVHFTKQIDALRKDIDFIARIGGEEFILITADSSPKNAQTIAQKILAATHHNLARLPDYSCSIGFTTNNDYRYKFDELFSKADKGLYYVKNNNKNNFKYEI